MTSLIKQFVGDKEAKEFREHFDLYCRANLKITSDLSGMVGSTQIRTGEILDVLARLEEGLFVELREPLKSIAASLGPASERHALPSPYSKEPSEEWQRLQRILGILTYSETGGYAAWCEIQEHLGLPGEYLEELIADGLVKRNKKNWEICYTVFSAHGRFNLKTWREWAAAGGFESLAEIPLMPVGSGDTQPPP